MTLQQLKILDLGQNSLQSIPEVIFLSQKYSNLDFIFYFFTSSRKTSEVETTLKFQEVSSQLIATMLSY